MRKERTMKIHCDEDECHNQKYCKGERYVKDGWLDHISYTVWNTNNDQPLKGHEYNGCI